MSSTDTSSSLSPQPPETTPNTSVSAASSDSLTRSCSPASLPSSARLKPKPKPANVFSNDGSFLERFQKTKMDEQEKKKVQTELERKINFEDRFKNRAKRKLPPLEDEDNKPAVTPSRASNTGPGSSLPESPQSPVKRAKTDHMYLNEYQQELKKYSGSQRGLSDSGTGVRPLVK